MVSETTPPASPGSSSAGSPSTAMATLERFADHLREAVTRPSWAITEEDDDEENQIDSHHRGKHPEEGKGKLDHHQHPEKHSLLPMSPPHSKLASRDIRHWVPSTTRHVLITPEMLREQSNLDDPYNPNPFDPEVNGDEKGMDGGSLSRKDGRVIVTNRGTMVAKRRSTWAKLRYSVLNRGYIPVVLRLISLIFSILAVLLAAFITRNSVVGGIQTRPSTVMAFVVNGVAIFYLPWAARDEYFGRAIGIRSASAKLRFVLLDLVFIILNSADVALAFNVLYDSEAGCLTGNNDHATGESRKVCRLQGAMAAVLVVTLLGFVINLTVSLYRLVERIIATEH